jgi:hypothetical protein
MQRGGADFGAARTRGRRLARVVLDAKGTVGRTFPPCAHIAF